MDARFEYRLDAADKELVERAASLSGVSASTFQRTVVVRAAREAILEAETVTLDPKAAQKLLDALEAPFEPNDALRRALERGSKLGL